MIDLINLKSFANSHLEHEHHLLALEQLQSEVDSVLNGVSLDRAGAFKFVSKVCCYTTASTVSDLNSAILQSLKIGSHSAAEALSRTSLENSINLILFGTDPTSGRPKSMLAHYFSKAESRAKSWLRYAKESNNTGSIERASDYIQSLNLMRSLFGDLDAKSVKHWEDAASRFKSAGYEHFYHIIFAPASDSTHGFSNDIFNNVLGEMLPMSAEERRAYFDGQLAEKISFSYYLAAHSVLFYCVAAHHIAERAGDEEAIDKLIIITKALESIISEHETLTTSYFDLLSSAKIRLNDKKHDRENS